jgi:hypothetical protein
MSTNQLPTEIASANRLLTAAEFHKLADVPPEVEWFANIGNPNTKRSYEVAVGDFMRFTGRGIPDRNACARHQLARQPGAARGRRQSSRTDRQSHIPRDSITVYLSNGCAMEHAQSMAAHGSPRTTKLYDRTKRTTHSRPRRAYKAVKEPRSAAGEFDVPNRSCAAKVSNRHLYGPITSGQTILGPSSDSSP